MPTCKLPNARASHPLWLLFEGKLDPDNGWIRLTDLIPRGELEKLSQYRRNFGETGNPARNFRIAFGALIIQTKLSDEETAEQVRGPEG